MVRTAIHPLGFHAKNLYKVGEVIAEYKTATVEQLLKMKGKIVASLELVGAGGGYGGNSTPDGSYWAATGTGGSGAAFVGIIEIMPGVLKLKVGLGGKNASGNLSKGTPGGTSYLTVSDKSISAGGGDAASAVGNSWNSGGGVGGVLKISDNSIVKSRTVSANGKTGPSKWSLYGLQNGAASVYKSYGEGCKQPTSGISSKGGDGYLRLIYLGRRYVSGKSEELAATFRK